MHITPHIDYVKLASAEKYYGAEGFDIIEVPWIVPYSPYISLRPPNINRREFYTLDGYLNASGETSFLTLMQGGVILRKNACVTACFRDEEVIDETHYKYFMKLELIDTDVSTENLNNMIASAQRHLNQYCPTKVVATNEGVQTYDIVDERFGIEVGSYGVREVDGFRWIYGTGIALPRLDVVIEKYRK